MIAFIFAVLVAVLDTGIAYHDHFAAIAITGDRDDTCGHGTGMAGIVVDNAPHNVELLSIRVSTDCLSNDDRIAYAIRLAADSGADVILVAWNVSPVSDLMVGATEYAEGQGAVVVFSQNLESSAAIAPDIRVGYRYRDGKSIAAARLAGWLAWNYIEHGLRLPQVYGRE